MDAIEMLEEQHDEVDAMFKRYEELGEKATQRKSTSSKKIADALAMHATIEEKDFYPAVKAKRTEILLESLEEHLGIKRVIADLLKLDPSDETFDPTVKVLRSRWTSRQRGTHRSVPQGQEAHGQGGADHHRQRKKRMDSLEAKGEPRNAVPAETKSAASLD